MNRGNNLPVEHAVLVEQIRAYVSALPGRLGKGRSDSEWTAAIKCGIGQIGRDADFLACASGYPSADDGEWLYDLIWFHNSPGGYLKRLELALESEWCRDPGAIFYDFEKLLVARAPIKVMIFQDNGDNLGSLWEKFDQSLRTYQQHGEDEIYLLAAFREEKHAFEFKQGTVQELLTGRGSAVMNGAPDTFDSLWDYCTANQRVAPMPTYWNALYQLLKGTQLKPSGGWIPPLPLILAAWQQSTALEKQMCLREHLEWAQQQDQLEEIAAFLRALPESDWCHIEEH